jgi:glycerophosphoryl diester phosphodiesterase
MTAGDARAGPLHPFLDHEGPIAFAHRGGGAEAPENTMAAFEHAVRLGYGYLELDVRATSDGEVVVFHDATLDRVTDRTGRIDRMSWRELREVRVDGTETVPRLVDVFDAWPDVRVNIDPKGDAAIEPLARLLRDHNLLDRVCVMAFSDRRLTRLRRLLGPRLCTALGPAGMTRLRLAASGVPIPPGAGDIAQVPPGLGPARLLDAGVMRAARRHGLPVHVWVVDYPGEMHRLLDLGVDGIMTDRPSALRQVLTERGLWR